MDRAAVATLFKGQCLSAPALPGLHVRGVFGAKIFGTMNNLRSAFSVAILLFVPMTLRAAKTPESPAAKTYHAYVGTYTAKTDSKGIYQFTFDPATGKMSGYELAAEPQNPSWVLVHPNGKYLYAANEEDQGSTISAFS